MGPAKKKQRLSNGHAVDTAHDDAPAPVAASSPEASPAKDKKVPPKRSLFVRSLPASTTTESLTELFSNSYPIKHATAVLDKETKECRGYGFVTFADEEDAARARAEFQGYMLEGKKLRVEIAEPRGRQQGEGAEGEGGEKAKKEQEMQQPPKLIVRNLPWSIKGSEQLTKLFQSYGKVKQAYVPRKGPGLMAGFGFVIMRGRKNAEKAIEGVNGKEVDGRTLAVDWAVDKSTYEEAKHNEEEDEDEDEEDAGVAIDEDDSEDDEVNDGEDEDDEEEEESDQDDEDEEDLDMGEEEDDEVEDDLKNRTEDKSCTIFVRNLPFTCTDEDLEDHFSQFGTTRYARVVMDWATERSKGTGFVCFYNKEDAMSCLRDAPRPQMASQDGKKHDKGAQQAPSILQNDTADPTGRYTLDGRVLQVSAAVDKSEAHKLTKEGTAQRTRRDNDKRRLYLLSEGTISSKSKLWEKLSPSEKAMRQASAEQRKKLIESNPSLHLSLTRLAVRNIPRSVGSKELKALAREAVVGFASDVKAGLRERLSKEELARGGEEMQAAEQARKRSGKGVVKQAVVAFEGASGTKVGEETGAGRSRGYGFIEYHTHRSALMGLRWLNGHAVGYQVQEGGKGAASREDVQDRKKRLIVEFAIENAQVVQRRKEKEDKARARSIAAKNNPREGGEEERKGGKGRDRNGGDRKGRDLKRKRVDDWNAKTTRKGKGAAEKDNGKKPIDEKLARRNQIIGRKRASRKARKGN